VRLLSYHEVVVFSFSLGPLHHPSPQLQPFRAGAIFFATSDDVKVLERIYDRFNARDIDGVLTALTDDVAWANGMDGGHVHGREAVREYWTRQWTMVSPHVEPVGFHRTADGAIIAEVRQSVRDLEGKPLQGQTHGLKDKTVGHVFRLREGKVARFDIQDAA
jgi:ketosteroid isomerase-like protein